MADRLPPSPLSLTVTRAAAARYREAAELVRKLDDDAAARPDDDDDESDPHETWASLANDAAILATDLMIRCTLAMSGRKRRGNYHEAEMVAHRPQALLLDGRLYVAYPDPAYDMKEGEPHPELHGTRAMQLLNLSVEDLVTIPDAEPVRRGRC